MARRISKARLYHGIENGYRSGLEDANSAHLSAHGVSFLYEPFAIQYVKPSKPSKYTKDFVLDNGIIIETKGRFMTGDRQKHKLILQQHPGLDIRFVFSNPKTRIGKTSKTTYADWCVDWGFQYAAKLIPLEWVEEDYCQSRWDAIEQAKVTKKI